MKYFDSIQIRGNADFIRQTEKALRLLKSRTPRIYKDLILRYLSKIRFVKGRPGMELSYKTPVFMVDEITAWNSIGWYASCILHDTFHARQYRDYKEAHGKVPTRVYYSQAAELEAIKFQIKTAKKLRLSPDTIKYLRSLDGSHIFKPRG